MFNMPPLQRPSAGKRLHSYASRKARRLPPDAARRPPSKGGSEGNGRQQFNPFAIKQRDRSTSFDKGCCCRSPDPVAAARDDSYLPTRRKRSSIYSAKSVRQPKSATCGHLAERNRKHVKHVFWHVATE